jgi:hypothetical protein
MTCSISLKKKHIKWEINPFSSKSQEDGNKILESLFHKNEYTGTFQFELKNNEMLSSLLKLKSGDSSSVESIPSLVNMHTHNLPNYLEEKCIFASPSGEDMRECIRMGLKGNLCHLVFSLEGTYVIQVNPCYLDILRKSIRLSDSIKDNVARGVIVHLIECYFRSTHGHRTVEHNKKMEKKNGICYPDDWIKFANEFKFSNFFEKHKNNCSLLLPCNGIPSFKNKNTISAMKYFRENLDEQFELSVNGNVRSGGTQNAVIDILENHFQSIIDMFDKGCSSDSTYSWKKGQFFYTQFFPNKFKVNDKFVTYNQLIDTLNKKGGSLVQNIFNYWKSSTKNHIRFDISNLPYIQFHPLEGKNDCKIVSGKEILNWINGTGVNSSISQLKK